MGKVNEARRADVNTTVGTTPKRSRKSELRGAGYEEGRRRLSPGRGAHDLGSQRTETEELARGSKYKTEMPSELYDRLPALAEYQAGYEVFSLPHKHYLAAFGRAADMAAQGVSVKPPTDKATDRAFHRKVSSSKVTPIQDLYTDWSVTHAEMVEHFEDYLTNRQLLNGGIANLRRAKTRMAAHAARAAAAGKAAELAEIRKAADTLAKMVDFAVAGRGWVNSITTLSKADLKASGKDVWSKLGGGGLSMSDVMVVAMGDAGEYLRLEREVKALTTKAAELDDKELAQDLEAAHESLTGWRLKADHARAEHLLARYQVTARNKAADFAKLRTGSLAHADKTLMAEALYEMSAFGQMALAAAERTETHAAACWKDMLTKYPGLLRGRSPVNDPEAPLDLRHSLFTLVAHIREFEGYRKGLHERVPAARALESEWQEYLNGSAGRVFDE